jgi:hypothetical protein
MAETKSSSSGPWLSSVIRRSKPCGPAFEVLQHVRPWGSLSPNYDGLGTNASNNNSLRLFTWLAL